LKIILSRKGFDDKYGGIASPIFEDGTMLSLPIPPKEDKVYYKDLSHNGVSYLDTIKSLNPKTKIKDNYTCHLDPDIRKDITKRSNSWKPLFGQSGSALGHLNNEKIKVDDIFLFFGTFKHTTKENSPPKYRPKAKKEHIIYGYFQIGKIHRMDSGIPERYNYHPHANKEKYKNPNYIFEASDKLSIMSEYNGSGNFKFNDKLVLTKPGLNKSHWDLPEFFKDTTITYHKKDSWTPEYFQSTGRGQEFVINPTDKIIDWTKDIIKTGMN